MSNFFPIFLDLNGQPCLVVGAGEIATGKARQLLQYGARLTIVAPDATRKVRDWAAEGTVTWHARPFEPPDVDGMLLVVASTSDAAVNRQVFEAGQQRRVLTNVVDVPELCRFIYGAVVQRGDLCIAISTAGRFPSLSAHIRQQLEIQFVEEYGQYLDILAEARLAAQQSGLTLEDRKQIYRKVLGLDLLQLLRDGRADEARRMALECVSPSQD